MKKFLITLLLLLTGFANAQWEPKSPVNGLYTSVFNTAPYLERTTGLVSGSILYSVNSEGDTSKYEPVYDMKSGLYKSVLNKDSMLGIAPRKVQAQNIYIMNLDELLGSYLAKSDTISLISTKQNVLNQIWNYVGDTSNIAHLNHNESVTGRWTATDLFTFNDSVITTDVKYTSLRTTPQTITNDTVFATNGSVFTKTLSASITVKLSGLADGQIITVALTNTASNYTVAWSALNSLTLVWSGGSAPTQTTGVKTDFYSFQRIGNNIYGAAVQNF